MRIAVTGKGGSGKTTISAVLARLLAREGREVLALDADTNPNLGLSLGLGTGATAALAAARQALDEEDGEHAGTVEELVERFGADATDGVRLVQVSKIEHPDPG